MLCEILPGDKVKVCYDVPIGLVSPRVEVQQYGIRLRIAKIDSEPFSFMR